MKEYKSDEVNVTVTAADKNDLPEDAELVVEPVELSEKTEKKVEEAALKEKRTVKKVHAYDIHFELYGEEIPAGRICTGFRRCTRNLGRPERSSIPC